MSTRPKIPTTVPTAASGTGTGSTRPRVTPRNSNVNEDAATVKETPYNALSQLSRVMNNPATPSGRALSAGPPSTRRSTRRTPMGQQRTPGRPTQPGSTRRPITLTPHAQAAVKANDIRRAAALTPGNDRRRSGRQQQRDTPQEPLRALSRLLAPTSKAVEATPQIDEPPAKAVLVMREDSLDNTFEPRPRLSVLLDDDEDDSLLLPPTRSVDFADDENLTQRSVELPRRALIGQPMDRMSLESFGDIRTNDAVGVLNEQGLNMLAADGDDSTMIQQGDYGDLGGTDFDEDVTGSLQRPYLEDGTGRTSLVSGQASDTRYQGIPEDDTETTFLLPLPQRDSSLGRSGRMESEESDEDQNGFGNTREQMADIYDQGDSEVDEVEAEQEDMTVGEIAIVQSEKTSGNQKKSHRIKKRVKISKYGIQYPSLPVGVVKRLATTFLKTSGSGNGKAKLSKDTLEAIMQASDWFFEQASDDLGTYAEHAGRKTIDEADVVTLMKRQRQTNATTTPFALAQRHLPRELLQELRMAQPTSFRLRKGRHLDRVDEEEEGGD